MEHAWNPRCWIFEGHSRYGKTFFVFRTQLCERLDVSFRVKISCRRDTSFIGSAALYVLSFGNIAWHSCERAGSLTSVIRLLKTRHLTTWTPVYTVVKLRTCRRAIIVTIREPDRYGLKLLRNHGMQLRGSRFRIIRLPLVVPSLPFSPSPFPTIPKSTSNMVLSMYD